MIYLTNINLSGNELQNAVVQPLATPPSSPKLGQIYCDSTSSKIKWYDGTAWKTIGVVVESSATNGHITVDGVDMAVYTLPTVVSDPGKVITGLSEIPTRTNVKDLELDGITPITGGYVPEGATLGAAIAALDTAVQNAVAGGGEVNQNAFSNVAINNDTGADIGIISAGAKTDTVKFKEGANITLTADDVNKSITITSYDTTYSPATTSANGLMSAEDKAKLNNIAAGAGVNVNANWAAESGDAQILNKPTALSDFTNDENFIDNTVENLVNYYKKTETYTKNEVGTLIGQIATIQISVVSELPASGVSNIIYLIPKVGGTAPNVKDEYLWTGSAFEKIGDTEIDLTNYLTKTGDLDTTTITFDTAVTRVLPVSTEATATIIGKITRYLADIKPVAFTGSYADLLNKPREYIMKNVMLNHNDTTGFIESDVVPVAVEAHDATTGECVMVDYAFMPGQNPSGLTISISTSYTNTIVVTAIFPVSRSSGDTFND